MPCLPLHKTWTTFQQMWNFTMLWKFLHLANHQAQMLFLPKWSSAMIPLLIHFTTFFASVGMKVVLRKKWGTPRLRFYIKTNCSINNYIGISPLNVTGKVFGRSCCLASNLLRRGSTLYRSMVSAARHLLRTWSSHCAKSRRAVNNAACSTSPLLT